MQTLFSIIIPVYNRRHWVKATIDSVLAQTYRNFEVIIVDDGSTDNTGEFIKKEFADPRIKYFYKTNEERGAARNYGIQQASGQYALFIDSDDLMEDFYLLTLLNLIEKHPQQHFLAAKYNFRLDNGSEIPSTMEKLKEGFYNFDFFLEGNFLGCNYCIKIKDSFFKLFPPERELASMEDWLFVLLNTSKKPIYIIDRICVHMCEHANRSMNDNQKVVKARMKATEWVFNNLELSASQIKRIKTGSHYFCGIHLYLDNNRKQAITETIAAIKTSGINKKFVILLGKALLGKELIKKLK